MSKLRSKFQKVRGVSEKLNSQVLLEKRVFHLFSEWFTMAAFEEIELPIIEPTELYLKSVGDSSDIANKEMFILQNRNEDESFCLRPEFTAGTFRTFLELENIITKPWRVFSKGPCFRYERPQKGRGRQFDQINIEIIEAENINYTIELIMMLDRFFSHKLNITNYSLKINSLGKAEDRARYNQALVAFLQKEKSKICEQCKVRLEKNPLRALDCKNKECQLIYVEAPKTLDFLGELATIEFKTLCEMLDLLSVNYIIDSSLVRGLDYYDGIVFEFISLDLGAQNTFCGGGQYCLGSSFDLTKNYLSVGAGIGFDHRLCLLVDKKLIEPVQQVQLIAVLPLKTEFDSLGILMVDFLRKENFQTILLGEKDGSVKSKMKQANKMNACIVIFIGEDEVATNTVTIKHMGSGLETKISQQNVSEKLKEILFK